MSRARHRTPGHGAESDDAGSFGGLADVLEPDADAITSLRRMPAASIRHASLRAVAPAETQDFAFADTVHASELADDGPPPPSGPIFVQDGRGNTQCVTPLAFRLPMPADDVNLATRLRILLAHARHAIRGSIDEMRGLWAETDVLVEPTEAGGAARHLRRVLALWSFFHWNRTDLTRAAIIGLAVFITAATLGATTMDIGASSSATSSSEVRARRTLDQHTGKNFVVRSKR
jgi:hypothetical protein